MNKRPTLKLKTKPAPGQAPAAPKLRPSYHPDLKPVLQPGFQPDLRADSLAFCLLGAANAVAQVRTGTALPQALTSFEGWETVIFGAILMLCMIFLPKGLVPTLAAKFSSGE